MSKKVFLITIIFYVIYILLDIHWFWIIGTRQSFFDLTFGVTTRERFLDLTCYIQQSKKVCIASLAATYSPVLKSKVPLALWGFTSEFGMGSSVSPTL